MLKLLPAASAFFFIKSWCLFLRRDTLSCVAVLAKCLKVHQVKGSFGLTDLGEGGASLLEEPDHEAMRQIPSVMLPPQSCSELCAYKPLEVNSSMLSGFSRRCTKSVSHCKTSGNILSWQRLPLKIHDFLFFFFPLPSLIKVVVW